MPVIRLYSFKIFAANVDANSVARITFHNTFLSKCVRIIPTNYGHVSKRIELFGCRKYLVLNININCL